MNKQLIFKYAFVLLALVIFGSVTFAQQLAATEMNSGLPTRPEPRQISSLRSQDTATGSRVILTFNGPIDDYGAYRNSNRLLVLIPGAELALTEISVKGRGFSGSKVEARGTNLAISFQLEPNVTAGVSQNGNTLELTFINPTLIREG